MNEKKGGRRSFMISLRNFMPPHSVSIELPPALAEKNLLIILLIAQAAGAMPSKQTVMMAVL